jgi:hypothetical protein
MISVIHELPIVWSLIDHPSLHIKLMVRRFFYGLRKIEQSLIPRDSIHSHDLLPVQ